MLIISVIGLVCSLVAAYFEHQKGNKDARLAWTTCAIWILIIVLGELK